MTLWEYEYNAYKGRGAKRDPYRTAYLVSVVVWAVAVIIIAAVALTRPEPNQAPEEIPESEDPVVVEVVAPPAATYQPEIAVLPEPDVEEAVIQTEPAVEVKKPEQLAKYHKMLNVKITHYCCEKRKHICGTGDGITATGKPVTPYHTCAVDPIVIPYGAKVLVDFGDGELHEYRAEDCGGSVNGAHVDLAVQTHSEALLLGVKTATVYWIEED